MLLGDAILDDWRKRSKTGVARMRAYYDVLPARESAITLDAERKNPWGDPLPRIDFVDSDWSKELREHTESEIRSVYERIAAAGDGKILSLEVDDKTYDHPGGGAVWAPTQRPASSIRSVEPTTTRTSGSSALPPSFPPAATTELSPSRRSRCGRLPR
jgi:hypothetical protein